MDKQLREKLKHDRFVEEVGHTVHYLQDHRAIVRKYGGAVLGVLVLIAAVWWFLGWRERGRQEDLRQASLVLDAFIGPQSPTGGLAFPNQQAKDAAALKAFSEVAQKHSGTREGQLARYYAATQLCDQGKVTECEAGYKEASQGGDRNVASLAKLSLATIYESQGKLDPAETLARELVNNPTPVVSKEQAQLVLAKTILRSKPQEARLILEALQALDRPAVTRAAVQLLGEMSGAPMPR